MYLKIIYLVSTLALCIPTALTIKCASSDPETLKFSIINKQNNTGNKYVQIFVEEYGRNRQSAPLDVDIEHKRMGCENTDSILISATISESPTPSPEPGYEFVPNVGYYKLHTAFKNWHAARIICMQEGAHLAIINSFVEVSILKKLWTPYPKLAEDWTNEYAFIGVSDLKKTKNFVTIFDQPLNTTGYENWAFGYPNFTGDCLVIARDGRIHEINCEHKLAFLCERYFK